MDAALKNAYARLEQGPVQVVVDPGGTDEIEIFVRDGLEVSFMRGQADSETDVIGVYDIYTTGDNAEFELTLQEISVNILNTIFRESYEDGNYVGFGRAAGYSLRDDAKVFRIRPWQQRVVATYPDAPQLELWKCVPSGDATLSMTKEEPWNWVQTFRCLPDLTEPDGQLIGRMKCPSR